MDRSASFRRNTNGFDWVFTEDAIEEIFTEEYMINEREIV
jgi:hypothetical protein